jgi:hypothetical protein
MVVHPAGDLYSQFSCLGAHTDYQQDTGILSYHAAKLPLTHIFHPYLESRIKEHTRRTGEITYFGHT